MMTLAQKIRWSGSGCRTIARLLALSLCLGSLIACSHYRGGRADGDYGIGKVTETPERGSIRFSVYAPEADGVKLFIMKSNAATPVTFETRARDSADGNWSATLDLIPGEYRYFFLVDGTVTVDREGGRVEQDDFGGVTGVLTVHQTPEGKLETF